MNTEKTEQLALPGLLWDDSKSLKKETATVLCDEAIRINQNQHGGQAATLKCKRWSCPICRPVQRRRVIQLARAGKPEKFITLTCRPSDYATPAIAAQGMRDAFAVLVRRIRSHHPGRPIEYIRVFERTKAGWPHMHVLMRCPYIKQKWLSEQWQELSGAYIVDIRAVDDVQKATYYVTKYIGKDLEKFEGVTRWFRSKGWNEKVDEQASKIAFGDRWSEINTLPRDYFWKLRLDLEAAGADIDKWLPGYARWFTKKEYRKWA